MINLTEESGPSQDIRTESELPWHLFVGLITMEMGFRCLEGLKKVEEVDDSVKIWGFVRSVDERVAID